MTTTTTDSVLRLREGAVTWREIDGELVLLDLQTSSYLNVNGSGTLLWPLLQRGTTVREMAQALSEHFDVPAAEVTDDVRAFVEDAREHRYVEA